MITIVLLIELKKNQENSIIYMMILFIGNHKSFSANKYLFVSSFSLSVIYFCSYSPSFKETVNLFNFRTIFCYFSMIFVCKKKTINIGKLFNPKQNKIRINYMYELGYVSSIYIS